MHFCALRFVLPTTEEQKMDLIGGTIHMRAYGPGHSDGEERVIPLIDFTAHMADLLKDMRVIHFAFPERTPIVTQLIEQFRGHAWIHYWNDESLPVGSISIKRLIDSTQGYAEKDPEERIATLKHFDEALSSLRAMEASSDAFIQSLALQFESLFKCCFKSLLPLMDQHRDAESQVDLSEGVRSMIESMMGLRLKANGEFDGLRTYNDSPYLMSLLLDLNEPQMRGNLFRLMILKVLNQVLRPYGPGSFEFIGDPLGYCEQLCAWLSLLNPMDVIRFMNSMPSAKLESLFQKLERALLSLVDLDLSEQVMTYRRHIVRYVYPLLCQLSQGEPEVLYQTIMKKRIVLQALWMVAPEKLYTPENVGRYFSVTDLMGLMERMPHEGHDIALNVMYRNPGMLSSIESVDHPLPWLLGLFERMKNPLCAPQIVLQRTLDLDESRVTAMLGGFAREAIMRIDDAFISDEAKLQILMELMRHVINDAKLNQPMSKDLVCHIISLYNGIDDAELNAKFAPAMEAYLLQVLSAMTHLPSQNDFYQAMHQFGMVTFFDADRNGFEVVRDAVWSIWSTGFVLRNFKTKSTLYLGNSGAYHGDLEEVANALMNDLFGPEVDSESEAESEVSDSAEASAELAGPLLDKKGDSGIEASSSDGTTSESDDDVQTKRKAEVWEDASDEGDLSADEWRLSMGLFSGQSSKRVRVESEECPLSSP